MPSAKVKKEYKSPVKKLAKFFEKSRDQWKAKCKEAKAKIKYLNNKVRDLEKSREKWKQKSKQGEVELKKLKNELEALRQELKNINYELDASRQQVQKYAQKLQNIEQKIALFQHFPVGHQYSLGQIMWFILFVFSAATSFRAASIVMQIISDSWPWPLKAPSWVTGRSWLLRLGYYKLTLSFEVASDWVWIIDHTVQIGALKCLVILGIRLENLPQKGKSLTHEDVEPIALLPVTKSNGTIVYQQLETTVSITGVPRAIVADHGPDLKSGIGQFCRKYRRTCFVYDIKHKTASILKKVLKDDPDWITFIKLASQTKKQIQQTALAALAPPNQRAKARYMNVDILISWGCKMLTFLDKQTTQPTSEFNREEVLTKVGWVSSFRRQLKEWKSLLKLVSISEQFIRKEGLYSNCHLDLQKLLIKFTDTTVQQMVSTELITFVEQQAKYCNCNERLLGSSEVIESVFGKLKRLEQEQSKSGFTSLLLSVAAMVSVTNSDVVQVALESVSNKQLMLWKEEALGKSVQAKRREAFADPNKTELKSQTNLITLTGLPDQRKSTDQPQLKSVHG